MDFLRVGFIVTNVNLPSRAVVRFYNRRGATEHRIKRRAASDALDTVVVSLIPGQRSGLAVERGKPMAAAGAPEEDRAGADQLAAVAGRRAAS